MIHCPASHDELDDSDEDELLKLEELEENELLENEELHDEKELLLDEELEKELEEEENELEQLLEDEQLELEDDERELLELEPQTKNSTLVIVSKDQTVSLSISPGLFVTQSRSTSVPDA